MDESINTKRIGHVPVVGRSNADGTSGQLTASSTGGPPNERAAPGWQRDLPELGDLPVQVARIPAGLWLRQPNSMDLSDDELCDEPPDQERMYIVLGAPGEQPPDPQTVADFLRALPAATRDAAVLCWYGGSQAAGAVADALAASVRTVHGVPSGGALVFVDQDGVECWRPFVQESLYRPSGPPRLTRWVPPPGLLQVEPASFGLVDGWRVDVVPRGLLVRPESVPAMPAWGGATGPSADVVVMPSEDVGVPNEVVISLDDVLRELPEDTMECLRLLPVDDTAAEALAVSEYADAIVLGEAGVALPTAKPQRQLVVSSPQPAADPRPALALAEPQPAPAAEPQSAPKALAGRPGTIASKLAMVSEPEAVPASLTAPPAASPRVADRPEAPVGAVIVTADGRVLPAQPIVATSAVLRSTPVGAGTPRQGPESGMQLRANTQPPSRWGDGSMVVAPAVVAPANNLSTAAVAGLPLSGPATAPHLHHRFTPPARTQAPPVGSVSQATMPVMSAPPPATPAPPAARHAPPSTAPAPVTPPADAVFSDTATPHSNAVVPAVDSTAVSAKPAARQPASVAALGSEVELLPTHLATVSQLQPPPSAERVSQPRVDRQPEVADDATPQAKAAEPAEVQQREQKASPSAPVVARQARATAVEVPQGVRSTAEQRRGMRKKLGSAYDTASRAVTRLLSERPGLRFGAGDYGAVLAELSVVRVFADNPAGSYDRDFYVCLADGLRRLPTARAVVVRSIPTGLYVQPEMIVRVPAPVLASPAVVAPPTGGAEALIWTTSGRRLDGLLDAGRAGKDADRQTGKAHPKDVVLTGHTRLRVLAVESDPVQRLLLVEEGAAHEAALARLRAAASARTVASVTYSTPDTQPWFQILPGRDGGVDESS